MNRHPWLSLVLFLAVALCLPRLAIADSHEEIINDCVAQMDKMAAAASTVKDVPSAEKAVKSIMTVAEELKKIAKRAQALGPPSEKVEEAMVAKMEAAQMAAQKRLGNFPAQMQAAGPEAAGILSKGMKSFALAMKEVDQAFEKADQASPKK